MSERSPSAAKERAYPFEMTRAEVGLAIDGVAHLVDATHQEAAPLLRRLQALYALSKDLEPVAADRLPDPASASDLNDRTEPAQAKSAGGASKEVPHDGRATGAPPIPVSAAVSPAEPPEAGQSDA